MFFSPRQAESCSSHASYYGRGSHLVRTEAFTAAISCACVDFVRACLHPSSLAAQPPLCTRPPNARHVRTLTARPFVVARRPRNHRLQGQQPQASGRGGLQPQQRCAYSASDFPTMRSGNQFNIPEGSEEDERRDEQLSRTRSPPAPRGGTRRSYYSYGSNGQVRQGLDSRQMMCLAQAPSSNFG